MNGVGRQGGGLGIGRVPGGGGVDWGEVWGGWWWWWWWGGGGFGKGRDVETAGMEGRQAAQK